MRLFRNKYKTAVALIFTLLLGAGGCVNDEVDCLQSQTLNDGDAVVVMQFTVVTRGNTSATRAVITPDYTEIGFPEENYIDLNRMQFLLFDSDKKLLQQFYPAIEAVSGTNFVKYRVTAKMSMDALFPDDDNPEITFSIMVLANYYNNLSSKNVDFTPGMTLSQCFTKSPSATFAMPDGSPFWKPSYTGNSYTDANGDTYSYNKKAYIPMSGLQTFTVNREELKASKEDQPLQISESDGSKDINMLRALAKIEVVDKINAYQDEEGNWKQPAKEDRTYIEKAELMGYFTEGSLLPSSLDAWNKSNIAETQYCSTPSVPSSASFISVNVVDEDELSVASDSKIINFFADAEATAKREDGCIVYSCYLTEYDYSKVTASNTPMWIRCTITNPDYDPNNGNLPYGKVDDEGNLITDDNGNQASSVPQSLFYRIEVKQYGADGKVLESGNTNIIRNNIYRYEVTSINQTIGIKWTVCTMDEAEIDIPTFN